MTEAISSTKSVGRRARGAAEADEKNPIGIIAEGMHLLLHRDPWRDAPSLPPESTP